MYTPQQRELHKYPSMSSVHTVISMGYLPPGHGYVPKKQKPDKPYGLSFTTRMNRTHRGPGKKYLKYALVCGIIALFFFMGTALYFGHRNVSRMIVMRTEMLGAVMCVIAIVMVSLMSHYIWKARVESNRWRAGIRFRPEGLNTAAAVNYAYVPESQEFDSLKTGTFGPKALKEIPKPKAKKKKKKGRSRAGSESSMAVHGTGQYQKAGTPQQKLPTQPTYPAPVHQGGPRPGGSEPPPGYYDTPPGQEVPRTPGPYQPGYAMQPIAAQGVAPLPPQPGNVRLVGINGPPVGESEL